MILTPLARLFMVEENFEVVERTDLVLRVSAVDAVLNYLRSKKFGSSSSIYNILILQHRNVI